VVTEPDAPTPRDPPRDGGGKQILPAKSEKRRNGDHVKRRNENQCGPIKSFSGSRLKFDNVLQCIIPLLLD
jgi:hypothetical protein